MTEEGSGARRFHGDPDRLRSPGRVALLEVERVVLLCLEGGGIASVLDVGTGTGVFAEAFAPLVPRVAGIDPDDGLLERARDYAAGVEFVEGIAERIPYPDDSFDLVFLGHVLHETDDPAGALREAGRVARRRVAVLEWPYVRGEAGPPLEHRLEPARIADLARQAGLKDVERLRLAHMDFYRIVPR
jgi:ubiquinone/menaquinone biosynthesis C-methylase UbiE